MRRSYKPLSLMFHPPNESHADTFHSAGGHCFNVQISHQWLEQAREHGVTLTESCYSPSGALTYLAAKLYQEFCRMDAASPLIAEGLVMEIIGQSSRSQWRSSEVPRWLNRAREIICEEFSRWHSLSEVAHAVGIHPTHLARAFRKYYGYSTGEYLQEVRIEFARKKLQQDGESLAEIALASGFSDQSHFSKTFRHLTGQTPAAFRRNNRQG